MEGRLDDARTWATITDLSPTEHSFGAAWATVRLACMLGDEDLLRAAARWVDRHQPPNRMRGHLHFVHGQVALHDGDASVAAASAWEGWTAIEANGVIRTLDTELIVVALLVDGQVEEARRIRAECDAEAERQGPLPRQFAVRHHATALIALHEGRDAHATDAAHALLEVAHRSGFVLMVIDALLMLAELADRRSSQVSAARLAGAATAARERIGYRMPLLVHLIDADGLAERLSNDQPTAFDDGSQLDLDGAVAFAQRMRGERNRPDFGWASLTPTERRVADLASEGCTNTQIAQRLLMRPATVKTHLTHTFAKLGVTNRTELARLAARTDTQGTQHEEPA